MTRLGKRARIGLILCAIAVFPLGAAWYGNATRGLNPWTAWACTSTARGGLGNVSGWDFEIEESHCDLVSRNTAITVYASPTGGSHGWFHRRKLLFRYTPGAADDLLPSFEVSGPNRILITVPEVSSVSVKQQTLGNVAVNYHIGRIEYPDLNGLHEAH